MGAEDFAVAKNIRKTWKNYEAWKERTTARRHRRLYWLRKYKEAKGCAICGYNKNGVALDFDHLDRQQKKFLPSSRNMGLTIKRIFSEIRKCRVLCANCHRIHSYEEKHFNNKRTIKYD